MDKILIMKSLLYNHKGVDKKNNHGYITEVTIIMESRFFINGSTIVKNDYYSIEKERL
jgi:hypothetical protein